MHTADASTINIKSYVYHAPKSIPGASRLIRFFFQIMVTFCS